MACQLPSMRWGRQRLECAVDGLAIAYSGTAPAALLQRVRAHFSYVTTLLDARKTLAEHRRLLVVGSWLSLLASTCLTDLGLQDAASAHLGTAAQLASEAGHAELLAWCLETRAWQVLIRGTTSGPQRYPRLRSASAPKSSSAYIQATAQEGRACPKAHGCGDHRSAPCHLGDLILIHYAGSPADQVTGYVDHAAPRDRVHPIAEYLPVCGHRASLFPGLPDCRFPRALAGLNLAGGELPGEAALSYPAPDKEHRAVPDYDGSGDRWRRQVALQDQRSRAPAGAPTRSHHGGPMRGRVRVLPGRRMGDVIVTVPADPRATASGRSVPARPCPSPHIAARRSEGTAAGRARATVQRSEEGGYGRDTVHDRGRRQLYRWGLRRGEPGGR